MIQRNTKMAGFWDKLANVGNTEPYEIKLSSNGSKVTIEPTIFGNVLDLLKSLNPFSDEKQNVTELDRTDAEKHNQKYENRQPRQPERERERERGTCF